MQNKTEAAALGVGDRLKKALREGRRPLELILTALTGFVMARCFLFGGLSPFGVALAAAMGGIASAGAAMGALAGYLLVADPIANITYMDAIGLTVSGKWLFGGRVPGGRKTGASVGLCFASIAICSGARTFLLDPTPYDIVIMAAEILLCCGACYFFGRAWSVLRMGSFGGGRADVSCVVAAGCVILMGLTGVTVATLSLGRIAGVFCVLICARGGREAGGAISGVAAGMSIALAGGGGAYITGACGLGGLAAGVFSGAGRIAAAASFIVVNTAMALMTMDFSAVNRAVLEVFIASLAFVAVPERLSARLKLRCDGVGDEDAESASQAALEERLGDISEALSEIGKTTQAVSRRLSRIESEGPESICERVAERICSGCGMKTSCWQLRHSATVTAMHECIDMLRRDGIVSRDQMPRHFTQSCCRIDELMGEMSVQFIAFTARDGAARRVAKVRAVLTDQFEGLSLMLKELSGELCTVRPLSREKTDAVREYFSKLSLTVQRLGCSTDRYGRVTVELAVPSYQAGRIARTRATLDLCSLIETDFDPPEVTEREKITTLVFREKASYTVELGAYQLSSGKNRICGDAYDFIRNKSGCAHMVISDGMGSGGAAAVDSAMACGLLVKLVNVGIGYEAALNMVNSALLVKSGEESLATIDCCSLDLFTGKASFYKAGAAPTYVVKNGKAGYVESSSLPAGILHGVSFDINTVTLHEGDIIVMVSDGVVHTGADWIKSELGGLKAGDMQRLAEKIALTAKMRRNDGHEDDITVLAAAIRG